MQSRSQTLSRRVPLYCSHFGWENKCIYFVDQTEALSLLLAFTTFIKGLETSHNFFYFPFKPFEIFRDTYRCNLVFTANQRNSSTLLTKKGFYKLNFTWEYMCSCTSCTSLLIFSFDAPERTVLVAKEILCILWLCLCYSASAHSKLWQMAR